MDSQAAGDTMRNPYVTSQWLATLYFAGGNSKKLKCPLWEKVDISKLQKTYLEGKSFSRKIQSYDLISKLLACWISRRSSY